MGCIALLRIDGDNGVQYSLAKFWVNFERMKICPWVLRKQLEGRGPGIHELRLMLDAHFVKHCRRLVQAMSLEEPTRGRTGSAQRYRSTFCPDLDNYFGSIHRAPVSDVVFVDD